MVYRLSLDACPFPRPFVLGFGECAAYEATEFVAGPIEGAALLTCRHLTVGVAGVGRYYPKCRIGGSDDRRRFVLGRAKPGS
jgi:hypothetical protein